MGIACFPSKHWLAGFDGDASMPVEARMSSRGLPNETNLIRRAAGGDLESFNQVVLAYQELAYNHALGIMNDSDRAEDVTQESFIKAYQKINQYQDGSFRAWLLRIVTHTAYDHLRRTVRHPTLSLQPENDEGEEVESPTWLEDPSPSTQDEVEQREMSAAIRRGLTQLPDLFRSVLILVDVYEMDYQDAAQALNVPVGTVRSRLARARMRLREILREKDESLRDTSDGRFKTAV